MSNSVKPVKEASPVVDVRLEVLNVKGRKAGYAQERRERISAYLKSCNDKPDFLSLVDKVAKRDVTAFSAALHERWIGADYKDITYVWKGNTYVNTGGYKTNHEALVYDSNLWEYLDQDELPIREEDLDPTLVIFLRNRFRTGVFRHKDTSQLVCVVTYHGPVAHNEEVRQNGLSGTSESCTWKLIFRIGEGIAQPIENGQTGFRTFLFYLRRLQFQRRSGIIFKKTP
jgi:hypothetical protein